SEETPSVTQNQRALVEAALLHPRALPDLFPRGAPRESYVSRNTAASDCPRTPRVDHGASHGARGHLGSFWGRGGAARVRDPGVLRVPDRVHAQPTRPALRHRSCGPGEVGHPDARQLVLGFRVPQLQLSPRAPLLRRRAGLPAAGAPARAGAVLRAPWHALAYVSRSLVRLVHPELRPAFELGDPQCCSGWSSLCRLCSRRPPHLLTRSTLPR